MTAEKIRERYKGCHYRLGFVGYRDYADEQRFEVAGFTHDVASVRERIMKVVAKGGGDAAEDVAGALDVVLRKMTWEGDVRILIFVADAPGHGRTLHPASVSDEYPDGDKFGLDPLSLVSSGAE